jgi:chemotaxis protein methyltransferase CheR
VAACASGEEAYTLAMLASDGFGTREPPVSIVATDISTAALERARRGRYRGRAVRGIDESLRLRHCVTAGDWLEVGERLKGLVEFRRHNLTQDRAPVQGEQRFELIACRNVLIYFDGPTVERVIHSLEGALAPEGTLILGAADRLCDSASRLARSEVPAAPPRTRHVPPERVLRRPLGLDPSGESVPPDAAPGSDIDAAVRAADEGDLELAVEITGRMLDDDPLDANAYLVRGQAELGLGHTDAAVSSLRRALYVDPSFGLAAFVLARAHERRGDLTAAARAYDQARGGRS